jgi:ribosomal protein S18 acetylase RimI-like enzyme
MVTQQFHISVRFMLKRDMPFVLSIERDNLSGHLWSEHDFMKVLQKQHRIGFVVERGNLIVAYAIIRYTKRNMELLNISVDKDYRRIGIATAIIKKLKERLLKDRRLYINIHVDETNLPMQLFLRSMGFIATKVIHNYYTDRDAYFMRFPKVAPIITSYKQPV